MNVFALKMALSENEVQRRITLLQYYRTEIRHEYDLITSRVGAFITAQSFLITVTGITLGNMRAGPGRLPLALFIGVVCLLGIASALLSRIGILAAIETAALWNAKKNRLFFVDPEKPDSGMVAELAEWRIERPFLTRRGRMTDAVEWRSLLFPEGMPMAFIISWFAIAGVTIFRFFYSG